MSLAIRGIFTNPSPPAKMRRERRTSRRARGEPMIWLTGGGLAVATLMIAGLLLLVVVKGTLTFWPKRIVKITTRDGQTFLGEIARTEAFQREGRVARRRLLRTGNFDLYGDHFKWINDHDIARRETPTGAWLFERQEWGVFVGFIKEIRVDGRPTTNSFAQLHEPARDRFRRIKRIEKTEIGEVNRTLEQLRLTVRKVELKHGKDSPEYTRAVVEAKQREEALRAEYDKLGAKVAAIRAEDARYTVEVREVGGRTKELKFSEIVRAYPANDLNFLQRAGVYLSRWREFLTSEPREANTEGGVLPAIFGTVMMTLIMSFSVAPFGVIAALYLREYAKQGPLLSAVRIAVNNLAGVPSIVFGVFGLGFFCYVVGGTMDALFFPERLPSPTYGTGGIIWASLTLALLTVPVVIVATEEALAAVPSSMREGSYACGASKWQTIKRIVLPRAMPGVMTGLILAMARGAGEVAPLMITGVVKLAPELPVDGHFPFLHLNRSFMHLGFHIYDVGFQSPNSEAAKPMVFTTTLLLILLIALLNLSAIYIRNRLKKRYVGAQF